MHLTIKAAASRYKVTHWILFQTFDTMWSCIIYVVRAGSTKMNVCSSRTIISWPRSLSISTPHYFNAMSSSSVAYLHSGCPILSETEQKNRTKTKRRGENWISCDPSIQRRFIPSSALFPRKAVHFVIYKPNNGTGRSPLNSAKTGQADRQGVWGHGEELGVRVKRPPSVLAVHLQVVVCDTVIQSLKQHKEHAYFSVTLHIVFVFLFSVCVCVCVCVCVWERERERELCSC